MFELGLSDAQAAALQALARHSDRSYGVQRRLLDVLAGILLGTPYVAPGARRFQSAVVGTFASPIRYLSYLAYCKTSSSNYEALEGGECTDFGNYIILAINSDL